ncbi:DUF3127 domain-containing protein [Spirosoma sp. BT702]|uniref:DUF3127 domain-containing protein n=1 Tax=Spirosoma profusum TaxID=2771354 RepID=A0A926XY08_9BACT|nr:DUF3127 domain-containing protein [Spirosoma profusum]MBD2700112.1 DUF3127 domain-containing protein [Spirosoma profusum]
MSDKLVITGTFLGAMATETVGQNNFLVRKFYLDVTTNPEWPSTPEFKLKGDKVNLVDNLQKGQTIEVSFNIDGRKYDNTDKGGRKGVITELIAWKIQTVNKQSAVAATRPAPAPAPAVPPVQAPSRPAPAATATVPAGFEGEDNDLPF